MAVKILLKNFLLVILIFVIISGIFALLSPQTFEKENEISFSQFTQELEEGKIKEIGISGEEISILYKSGEKVLSRKEEGVSIFESLNNYGVDKEKIREVAVKIEKEKGGTLNWLIPLFSLLIPILIFGWFFWMIFRQAKEGASQTFSFLKSPAKIFGTGKASGEKVTFKDIADLEEAKEEIKEIVDFLKNPKKFWKMGARIPRGVLLVGPPGTGKTMLARAVATESGVPFFSIAGSAFVELFVGVGSARVRSLFETAKKNQPSIVFIDELDAIGKIRTPGIGGGHEEREQTLNQILAEMDGFEKNTGVIVMSASVSGDTPVLIKQNSQHKLLPISEVIDDYYQKGEEGIEKFVDNFEVLGFEKKVAKSNLLKNNIYFQSSAFKKVRSVFRHKVNTIYEVKFNGGKIKTTGNHSLFVRTLQGIKPKLVSEMSPGDILVDLPNKVNRTNKFREIRAHKFDSDFSLELSVWQPLFEKFEPIKMNYRYALSYANELSQSKIAEKIGVSQTTISQWQQGICMPRLLSRNYYKYQNILPEKVKVTPELMRLFGYYIAEGYARKEIDFCLNRNEEDKIEDVKNLMKNIFNLTPDRVRYITPGAVNIVYFCKPLAEFFAHYCGKGAKNKHMPNFIFEVPFKYFQEFFRGYFGGDGYFSKKRKNGEVTSVSKQLILELNWLFRMQGFKSYITSFKTKEGRRIHNGKPLKETIAWRLGFGKTQNPLNEKDIRKKGSVCRPIVKSIKTFPYNGYVYDFCGCENEAFFAGENPILAHNTNRPEHLDPALLRPGRFDRRIVLDLPDVKGREEVLKIHCRDKPLTLDVNLAEVAERTPGFSGADLANLVNEAAILAARRNKRQIYQTELLESIEKVLLGPERKSHLLSKDEKKISAFHEAGHALVANSIPEAEEVRKISIIARGMTAGYTLALPKGEKRIKRKSEFLAELSVLLGGYCAEKLEFKEISTGAANDLEKASILARSLVTKYGMSKLGPVSFGQRETLSFLGWEQETERNYSEKIAAQIDKETERFIKEAERKATIILQKNKKILEKIAKVLIEKETIEKEEFEKLVKGSKIEKRKIPKKERWEIK